MVAEYLEKNYDRVRFVSFLNGYFMTIFVVLQLVYLSPFINQLRY